MKAGRRSKRSKSEVERSFPAPPREYEAALQAWAREQEYRVAVGLTWRPQDRPLRPEPKSGSDEWVLQVIWWCKTFLWSREFVWPVKRQTISSDVLRFMEEQQGQDYDEVLAEAIIEYLRKPRVRILRAGDHLREGEIEDRFRPLKISSTDCVNPPDKRPYLRLAVRI